MPFYGKIHNSWGGFTSRHEDTGNGVQTGWSHDLGQYNVNGGGSASYWIIWGAWTNGTTNYGYNVRLNTIFSNTSANLSDSYQGNTHYTRTSIGPTDFSGAICTYCWHTSSTAGWIRGRLNAVSTTILSPSWSTASAANSSNASVIFYDFF